MQPGSSVFKDIIPSLCFSNFPAIMRLLIVRKEGKSSETKWTLLYHEGGNSHLETHLNKKCGLYSPEDFTNNNFIIAMSLTRRPLSNIVGKQQMIFRNETFFLLLLKVYVVNFYYLTILIFFFFSNWIESLKTRSAKKTFWRSHKMLHYPLHV